MSLVGRRTLFTFQAIQILSPISANEQIKNMRTGFDKYNTGDAKAKELYETAFGKNADKSEVDKTIKALETGTLNVKTQTHSFKDGEIAAVPWTQQKSGDPWLPGPARFSKAFHGSYQWDFL